MENLSFSDHEACVSVILGGGLTFKTTVRLASVSQLNKRSIHIDGALVEFFLLTLVSVSPPLP